MKKFIVKITNSIAITLLRLLCLILFIFIGVFPVFNLVFGVIILKELTEYDDWFFTQLFYGITCISIFIFEIILYFNYI